MPATNSTAGVVGLLCQQRGDARAGGLPCRPGAAPRTPSAAARSTSVGIERQRLLQRALGEHEVLGPAPALRVEHVAAAERGVGPREAGIEPDRLVHHLHRQVEVGLVVRAQDVAEEGVAAAHVELVRLGAERERALDLGLLLGGERAASGPRAAAPAISSWTSSRSRETRSMRSLHAISPVSVSTSCAVTRIRSGVRTKPQLSTNRTASSAPTWRGSTLSPT